MGDAAFKSRSYFRLEESSDAVDGAVKIVAYGQRQVGGGKVITK